MSRAGLLLCCLAASLAHAFDDPDNKAIARRKVAGSSASSRPAKVDLTALAQANNRFALDLYGEMRRHDGNLFCSPLSVWAGLAMTSAGARGETLNEMTRALHLPAQGTLHPALGHLLDQLPATRDTQLGSACELWGQRGITYNPEFLSLMRTHYRTGSGMVDFAGATEQARQQINGWVEKQTRQQIHNLLRPGVLQRETGLVLTNAIYFKGSWASEFPLKQTREGEFHPGEGKSFRAHLMNQTGHFPYHETNTLQALELPYADGHTSMVVMLPRKPALAALEKELTSARLSSVLSALKEHSVEVTLPRFRLTVEAQLRKVLLPLGLRRAFADTADFSGITRERELTLSSVVHKACVEVEERGTKAAAATAANTIAKSVEHRAVFRADRPFVFLVRDTRTGCILFLGRVTNPRA